MNTYVLTGLDAQNPLGFFAALGLLRIVDWHHQRIDRTRPRLSFAVGARVCAQLECDLAFDGLLELVLEDAQQQESSLLQRLVYDAEGFAAQPAAKGAVRDLKPAPAMAREMLQQAARTDRRDADLFAALFSDQAQDNKGRTKPTALHFTAGQQQFGTMVEELRCGVSRDDLLEALIGPWRGLSELPSLSWDATQSRLYALRAANPSSEKRGSVAAANWLAFHGLAFFPVAARRGRLETASVSGGWKDGRLRWPIWHQPATAATIRSLLLCNVDRWSAATREARGVGSVVESRIERSDQGGYGSFSPAAPVLPRDENAG